VKVTDRVNALRELLVYGSYLQNHGTHLYVLAAPDFLGQKSVFPVADIDPALFDNALALKRLGNELCTAVGGRSIHPITASKNSSELYLYPRTPHSVARLTASRISGAQTKSMSATQTGSLSLSVHTGISPGTLSHL